MGARKLASHSPGMCYGFEPAPPPDEPVTHSDTTAAAQWCCREGGLLRALRRRVVIGECDRSWYGRQYVGCSWIVLTRDTLMVEQWDEGCERQLELKCPRMPLFDWIAQDSEKFNIAKWGIALHRYYERPFLAHPLPCLRRDKPSPGTVVVEWMKHARLTNCERNVSHYWQYWRALARKEDIIQDHVDHEGLDCDRLVTYGIFTMLDFFKLRAKLVRCAYQDWGDRPSLDPQDVSTWKGFSRSENGDSFSKSS